MSGARVMSGQDVADFCCTLNKGLVEAVRQHGQLQGGGTSPTLVSAVTLMFSVQCWGQLFPEAELLGLMKELTELCVKDHNELMKRVLHIASTTPLRDE